MVSNNLWNSQDPAQVAKGGHGRSTLTLGHVMIGNGTDQVTLVDMTTKGDLLVGDGSGAPQVLSASTDGLVLTLDSAETTGMKWAEAGSSEFPLNYRSNFTYFNDFLGYDEGWSTANNSAGSANRPGQTNSSGGSPRTTFSLIVGTTAIDAVWNNKLGASNETGTLGFANTSAGWGHPSATEFIYWGRTGGVGSESNPWTAYTTNSGGTTSSASAVTGDTDWHTFRININASASSIAFYLDDSLVATHTANLPTSGNGFWFYCENGLMDYIYMTQAITR